MENSSFTPASPSKLLPHNPEEFKKLLSLASEAKSILEIGSRYGKTLKALARAMPLKGRVVSVDLPGGPWGNVKSMPPLLEAIEDLKKEGFDAYVFLGDSKNRKIVEEVTKLGPYDLVFIDGDHSYEGVKTDWQNYGPLGKTVVFHDIAIERQKGDDKLEVKRLWRELVGKKEEFVASDYGLGIVYR